MARINLITRHSGESYGAVLQTYATCRILQSLGHKVTIINLMEKERVDKYFKLRNFFSYPKFINFWLFKCRNYPRRTRLMTAIDAKKIPAADYTVVGSDQVWNPQITKENGLAYFLDFDKSTRKISLASSFGKTSWEGEPAYTAKVKHCLQQFEAISVRESSGVDICKNTFGVNAECIIDPTIAWGDYTKFIKNEDPKQIGCFVLKRSNPLFPELADSLSKSEKMPVKLIDYSLGKKYECLKTRQKSPVRWMNEIHNSRFVITDSFHGVAFCLLFRKQFFVLCADESKFTRIASLLDKVGLSERRVKSMEDFNNRRESLMKPIDYTKVDGILQMEKDAYYRFVNTHIVNE